MHHVSYLKSNTRGTVSDSVKKLQDQKHDMEREIKILHRRLRVRVLQRCSEEGSLGSNRIPSLGERKT